MQWKDSKRVFVMFIKAKNKSIFKIETLFIDLNFVDLCFSPEANHQYIEKQILYHL